MTGPRARRRIPSGYETLEKGTNPFSATSGAIVCSAVFGVAGASLRSGERVAGAREPLLWCECSEVHRRLRRLLADPRHIASEHHAS